MLLKLLFPVKVEKLMTNLDDMSSSISYYKRLSRDRVEVESEAYGPMEMKLVADQGKYWGIGKEIIQVSE